VVRVAFFSENDDSWEVSEPLRIVTTTLSTILKRSLATLGVAAGLLAAAGRPAPTETLRRASVRPPIVRSPTVDY
jgi:hypothetical protein